jgi:acetylglutamate kinase
VRTPRGFTFAGINCGIKTARKDFALVFSEVPCAAAGCFTVNAARAAPVRDAQALLPTGNLRAIIANSGNANALTGDGGQRDAREVCAAVASALGVDASSVVSGSTGVIGVRLPVQKLVAAAANLAASRGAAIELAAEAVMTTDTRIKLSGRSLKLDGVETTIAAFGKGAGMMAPELATMLVFITTDAAVKPAALQSALSRAMKTSFDMVNIDGDMSTNDSVIAMANGLAGNPPVEEGTPAHAALTEAIEAVCVDLSRQMAEDGEGATKFVEVRLSGAPDVDMARELARMVAGSNLVKAAIFGADPNWGRVLAAVGSRVGSRKWPIDPTWATVHVQGTCVYADREPVRVDPLALRARMREPHVTIDVRLAEGSASATAWGCDLSYDYVKINADYTSLTH